MEIRSLSPILNLGFLYCRSGSLYRRDRKSELLTFLVSRLLSFFWIQGCDEWRQFVNVHVSIIFQVTVKYLFRWSYCTFSKCSLSVTHCSVNLCFFSSAEFFKLSSKFCSFVDPLFLGSVLFRNLSQTFTNRFFWNLLFSFLLRLHFYGTGLDELADTLHFWLLWLIYQHMPCPYTKFHFESGKGLHFFELTCSKSKLRIRRFRR